MLLNHEKYWPNDITLGIQRSCVYFENAGFKRLQSNSEGVVFQRGNLLQNQFTFDPLKWKSKVAIYHEGVKLYLQLELDTTGQLVRPAEKRIWEQFVAEWGLYIQDPAAFQSVLHKKRWSNKLGNVRILGVIFGIIVIAAGLGGFLAYITGINVLLTMVGAMAAASLIISNYIKRG